MNNPVWATFKAEQAGLEDCGWLIIHLDWFGSYDRHYMQSHYNCKNQEWQDFLPCQWKLASFSIYFSDTSLEMSFKPTATTPH